MGKEARTVFEEVLGFKVQPFKNQTLRLKIKSGVESSSIEESCGQGPKREKMRTKVGMNSRSMKFAEAGKNESFAGGKGGG